MDKNIDTNSSFNSNQKDDSEIDTFENSVVQPNKEFFVYLLQSSIKGATYVGATVNLNRRLRQHNKEIKGGANYTGSKVSQGETWNRICYVCGFPEWKTALQFEWRWKQISRKIDKRQFKNPLEKRMEALKILLSLEKATNASIPYKEWNVMPNVIYE